MKKVTHNMSGFSFLVRAGAILMCAGLLGGHPVLAGEVSATGKAALEPAPEETNYPNWVNLSLGGLILGGDEAQFKQANHISGPVFGGIEDMHYEKSFDKKTQLTIDGHGIFDTHDYLVKVTLSRQDLGYISAGYTQFRTWYDGNGGFISTTYPAFPDGVWFAPPWGNEFALDRSDVWVELGLRIPNFPELTLRYDHETREGQKDSTSWGDIQPAAAASSRRNIVPAYRNINEKRDIVTFEATQTIFGKTDLAAGMIYEHTNNDDALNILRRPTNPTAKRYVTEIQSYESDLFNGHFSSTTRFSDKVWFTAGYSYTGLNSDIGGSQIYGPNFYASYNPLYANRQNFDEGFYNLGGGSHYAQNVVNLNLLLAPIKDLTITPALRIGTEAINSQSTFTETNVVLGTATQDPMLDNSSSWFVNLSESLDVRYTGFRNTQIYFRGGWSQNNGNRQWNTNDPTAPAGNPLDSENQVIDYRSQQYTFGANWYPCHRLNIGAQYYHKIENIDYLHSPEIGILAYQNFYTDDFNIRITYRPVSTLSLVTRYDMQYVTMYNGGVGRSGGTDSEFLDNNQSAKISNNIISETVTWSPLSCLYVQGNASFVFNQTDTTASNTLPGPVVLNGLNNYWTINCTCGIALDQKTNLTATYAYYSANDYQDNSQYSVPYGAGANENSVSVALARKLTDHLSMSLSYSYYNYVDKTSGYHNNYTANMIYSGLQFRF